MTFRSGFTFGATKQLNVRKRKVKLGFSYSYYRGAFIFSNDEGYELVSRNNHALNVEFYPLNFFLEKVKLQFSAGLGLGFQLYSSGTKVSSSCGMKHVYPLDKDFGRKMIGHFLFDIQRVFQFNSYSQIGLKLQFVQGLTRDYDIYELNIYKTIISPQVIYEIVL